MGEGRRRLKRNESRRKQISNFPAPMQPTGLNTADLKLHVHPQHHHQHHRLTKKAPEGGPYSVPLILSSIIMIMAEEKKDKRRKRRRGKEDDGEGLEDYYENKLRKVEDSLKRYKMLLPLKTKKGLEVQMEEEVEEEDEEEVLQATYDQLGEDEGVVEEEEEGGGLKDKVVSLSKLVAQRRATLIQYKVRIGSLAAGFLEDPQNRMKNLDALLMIMDGKDAAVAVTVPKLCAFSLLTVFKDVLPSYAIKNQGTEGVKLKKETLHLQSFENSLLSKYKTYIKKLENLVNKYCPRKKPSSDASEAEASVGRVAVICMCGMLESHPYFNLSTNLVNFLVPFLNNWDPNVRSVVFESIKSVFKEDRRGEISYEIVRRVNTMIKLKMGGTGKGVVREEVLNCLLALRIKEADVQKEKEQEMIPKNKMTFEQRHMLSKRGRKKAKDLIKLEKELLEASAEENKEMKSRFLTDITKLVFTIYFRALKNETNSKILSCVLEGLSKFAHVISIEFFDDILKVLERLLDEGKLQQRQRLLCISTVMAVLDGKGSALTLDPTSFHKHLYRILIELCCGKNDSNINIALRCLHLSLGKRKMPGPRAVAFAKRLATLALQLEHNDSAAVLMALKQIVRLHPAVNVLFDCDGAGATGVYLPELDDPDHSCANASTMWEITSLVSHYHPWVRQLSKTFADINEKVPVEIATMNPELICQKFSPTPTEFIPPPPERKEVRIKTKARYLHFNPRTKYFREMTENGLLNSNTSDDQLDNLDFK